MNVSKVKINSRSTNVVHNAGILQKYLYVYLLVAFNLLMYLCKPVIKGLAALIVKLFEKRKNICILILVDLKRTFK